MTNKKSGRSRRTTPTSGRTRSQRQSSTSTASTATSPGSKAGTTAADTQATPQDQSLAASEAATESLTTATTKDSVGDAGAAKEAFAGAEGGESDSASTLSSGAGDSLSDDSGDKDSVASSDGEAEVVPPGAHRLTAKDILSEDTLTGGSGVDSLANSGTSAPLIEVTAKEVIEPPEEDTFTSSVAASSAAEDSDRTKSTSAADTGKSDKPKATASGGGGSGGSRQPPAAPPPASPPPSSPPPSSPPPGSRRSSLLKGVALGGVLVAVGYILAVGTSDLWLGKVVTPDSWAEQNQKIESLTKKVDGLASQPASDQIDSVSKQVTDLGDQVAALAKSAGEGSANSSLVKSLQEEVAAAKAAGADLQKQVADALKSAKESGQQSVAAVQKDLTDLQGKASQALDEVGKRLATLEAKKGPSAEVAQEIEGMRAAVSRLETRTNTLITRLTSDPKAVEDAIKAVKDQADKLASGLASLGDKTSGSISELSTKTSKEVSDLSAKLAQDLATLQSQAKQSGDALVAKVEGEVARLSASLSTAETALKDLKASLDSEAAALKASLEKEVAALKAELEKEVAPLKSSLATLSSSLGSTSETAKANKTALDALSGKIAEFTKTLQDRIDSEIEAALAKDMRPRAAALAMASASLNEAVQRGGAFTAEFDAVEKLAGTAPALQSDLASLKPLASAAVSSRGGLLSSFRAQIPKILAAADGEAPADGDLLDDAWGAVSSLVEVRPVGEITGDTAKAIVARAEQRLQAGNLTEAVSEVASLQGAAASAAAPWLTEARARLLALQAAERLQQAALASLAAQQN